MSTINWNKVIEFAWRIFVFIVAVAIIVIVSTNWNRWDGAEGFHSGVKRFGSKFNFGDHAAIGLQLGKSRQHEVALRIEHFSNAGIEHPNPGENFLQLRYSHKF